MKCLIFILAFEVLSVCLADTLLERVRALEQQVRANMEVNIATDNTLSSLEERTERFHTQSSNTETSWIVENYGATDLVSKRAAGDAQIAFYAYLSSNRCLSNNEMIMFDTTPSHLHTGYNTDGIFTPYVDGIYAFTWTIAAPKHQRAFGTELVVDGHVIASLTTDPDDSSAHPNQTGTHPATTFVLANVQAGSHIYVRMRSHSVDCRLLQSDSKIRSSFAGWLIF